MAAMEPPTTAPVFELPPPESDEDPVKDGLGEVVDTKDATRVVVKDGLEEVVKDGIREVRPPPKDEIVEIVDTPEGPKIAPGPYSGLSISKSVRSKAKIGDMMLTTCLIRCVGVPIILFLECVVNTFP